jgi:hypothetical protein
MKLRDLVVKPARWKPLKVVCAAVAVYVMSSCAVLPNGSTGTQFTRLIFTWTMEGPINPNYVYVVALNPSTSVNPTVQGPVPVVAAPWGNGFVAGGCQYFIRWDSLQSPNYILYQFTDATLNGYFQVGVPVNYVDITSGATQFQFEVDVNQLAATTAQAQALQSVQVNFLTMNVVPQGGSGGTKVWDALGNPNLPSDVNDYITVALTGPGIYNNARYGGELAQAGWCADPALNIVDFSVEVRTQ